MFKLFRSKSQASRGKPTDKHSKAAKDSYPSQPQYTVPYGRTFDLIAEEVDNSDDDIYTSPRETKAKSSSSKSNYNRLKSGYKTYQRPNTSSHRSILEGQNESTNLETDLALALQLAQEEEAEAWNGPSPIYDSGRTNYMPIEVPNFHSSNPFASYVDTSNNPFRTTGRDQHLSLFSGENSRHSLIRTQELEGQWEAYDASKWEASGGVSRQKLDRSSQAKECVVCAEDKPNSEFPPYALTDGCCHEPNTCLECVETHIKTELNSKVFHEKVVGCPECKSALGRDDIQQFAESSTFASYTNRATDSVIDQLPNFFRCPNAKCSFGQLHDSGTDSPIVTCYKCHERYCFGHKVVWHETLSCDEYDRFLINPRGFKSRFDLENEKADQEREEEGRRRMEQEEADRIFAQGLLDEEQRQEAQRHAEVEREQRKLRERLERERRETERRRADEARQRMQDEADRKKNEEAENLRTIERTTKKCPNCSWPIEKNGGCSHMRCIKCNHSFNWRS